MSARDIGNESDVEEELETSNKINKGSQNIVATSDSEPYVPAPTLLPRRKKMTMKMTTKMKMI